MKKFSVKLTAVLLILILAGAASVFLYIGTRPHHPEAVSGTPDIPFTREGKLWILKNGDSLLVDIEIADDNAQRMQGLMYRRTMGEFQGMLFIFDEDQVQTFWMKNTYLTLDMIFINSDFRIVSIQKYTQPLSESTYPSEGPAKYVLEVSGGFSDRHGLQPGDQVGFIRKN
ncbi:MAG: DUF192 domain-containing protein [Bacteroidetes bacterium]|nr:DUF192 domain-containing protein [Bacteroidota bacterium]